MNTPNLVSLSRVALVPVLAALLYADGDAARWWALGVYTFACLTDLFDGYLARRSRQDTTLGRTLDHIGDKLVVVTAVLMLTLDGRIGGLLAAPALVIILREILVSGLRESLAGIRVSIAVSRLAKYKTLTQMVALGFLIVGDAAPFWLAAPLTGGVLLWLAALIAVVTAFDYGRAAGRALTRHQAGGATRRMRRRSPTPRRSLSAVDSA